MQALPRHIHRALHTAKNICATKNARFTDIRQQILIMIWAHHHPSKAYDLLEQLQTSHKAAKPATIYRTLDFLLENGLIHRLSSLNAYIGCTHPLQHASCYFLICRHCNQVHECCQATLSESIAHTTKQYHFQTEHATVEIQGLCQHCQPSQ